MNDQFWERLARAKTHATQMRILKSMQEAEEPLSPKLLSDQLEEPIGNVSYHVKCLKEVGLLELSHTRPRRGAVEHFYREATPV
jgi:DNA-binding transcriptional ArsR family regulator